MEQRLSIITLGVENLNKSRTFYESLGWKVATEEQSENIVAFNKDVDFIFEEAKSAGAKIVKNPQKVFWGGYSSYFADP